MVKKEKRRVAQVLYFRLKHAAARLTRCDACSFRFTAMMRIDDVMTKCPECGKYSRGGNDSVRERCKNNSIK